MVPDRQKVRTDGMDGRTDGRTHGRRQNYIPPTSSGDNIQWSWKIIMIPFIIHPLNSKYTMVMENNHDSFYHPSIA